MDVIWTFFVHPPPILRLSNAMLLSHSLSMWFFATGISHPHSTNHTKFHINGIVLPLSIPPVYQRSVFSLPDLSPPKFRQVVHVLSALRKAPLKLLPL